MRWFFSLLKRKKEWKSHFFSQFFNKFVGKAMLPGIFQEASHSQVKMPGWFYTKYTEQLFFSWEWACNHFMCFMPTFISRLYRQLTKDQDVWFFGFCRLMVQGCRWHFIKEIRPAPAVSHFLCHYSSTWETLLTGKYFLLKKAKNRDNLGCITALIMKWV